MQRLNNGQRDVLIVELHEIREPEIRAAADVVLTTGGVVTVNDMSLVKVGEKIKIVADGQATEVTKPVAEVLDVIAAYQTAPRILAVLA